ncbi:MFS transporter [Streptomyces sp. NPDC001761]|uniref:MFS transporter n=1 Tax=Streptomyces spinosus TaxID=2872623 RepID=UPI001CEC6E5F|nr:MFS transporter [Streptomyces spinosus]
MAGPPAPVRRASRPLHGLLAAGFVSVTGTAMSEVAVPWYVLDTTGSTARTGLVAFAETAPYVLLQALSGPLVDRVGARRAYLVGNTLAAGGLAVIPVLGLAGALGLGRLAVLVALAGAARGVSDCAATVLLPVAAERGRLPLARAVALSTGATRTAVIVGSSLAGVLLAATDALRVVAVTAAAFAATAVLAAVCLPAQGQTVPRAGDRLSLRRYRSELAEGLRFLRADRLLLGILVLIAVTNLLDQAFSAVLLPAWVKSALDSPQALGLITGAIGAGAVLGSAASVWLAPRLPRLAAFRFGFLLAGAPRLLMLAVATSLAPVLTVSLVAGVMSGLVNPLIGALQYERIPPHLHARVLGAVKASAWVGIPVGGLLAGVLADGIGLRGAILTTGAVLLATTLVPFVMPSWRSMDGTAPAVPSPGGDTPAGRRHRVP